jgi:transposase, IS30 family
MASYKQFTQEERVMLSALRRAGHTQQEIGRQLKKDQSAVSRELKRNKTKEGHYDTRSTERMVRERRVRANRSLRKIENNKELETYVRKKLKKYWSPEQIAGRVMDDYHIKISHETIYQYIYTQHPELKKYLRCQKGKYRRRYGTKKREKQREESKIRRIDTRPYVIEKRTRIGDWEGDTVVGKRGTGSLLTYVDRTSRFTIIEFLERATAEIVREKTQMRFKNVSKKKRRTITYDNGSEFAEHEMIEKDTKAKIYFAYPYHSWERGTNENTNGLIRQFFPKGSSFNHITQKDTQYVERLLNDRPRKILGYLTPREVINSYAL